jgi:hypothetical protein
MPNSAFLINNSQSTNKGALRFSRPHFSAQVYCVFIPGIQLADLPHCTAPQIHILDSYPLVSRCRAEKALRQPSRNHSPSHPGILLYLLLTFLRSVLAGSTLLQLCVAECESRFALRESDFPLPAKALCQPKHPLIRTLGLRYDICPLEGNSNSDQPQTSSSSSSHALTRLSSGCAFRLC